MKCTIQACLSLCDGNFNSKSGNFKDNIDGTINTSPDLAGC